MQVLIHGAGFGLGLPSLPKIYGKKISSVSVGGTGDMPQYVSSYRPIKFVKLRFRNRIVAAHLQQEGADLFDSKFGPIEINVEGISRIAFFGGTEEEKFVISHLA
jgi:hypothetical protein